MWIWVLGFRRNRTDDLGVKIRPYFFQRLSSQISFEIHKGIDVWCCFYYFVRNSLVTLDLDGAKTMTLRRSETGWTPVHSIEEMRSTRMVQHWWNGGCSGKCLSNCWPIMTLCFCRNETFFRDRHNVVLKSRHTITPKRRISRVRILKESLLWEERQQTNHAVFTWK